MSMPRDVTILAAMMAIGTITEDMLIDEFGEDNIVQEVLALAGVAALSTSTNTINNVVDEVVDVVDRLNPFNW